LLLIGTTKVEEQNIRSRIVDAREDARGFGAFEIAGLRADDADVRPVRLDGPPCTGDHLRPAG
jgi:hypothetical protein